MNAEYTKNRTNVELISTTNSSIKAIEELQRYKPDAVILDLELNDGEGSGFDFIKKINEQCNTKLPKIVVTTNIHTDTVYDFCHRNNIDFIFYKKQKNYSQENIINTLILLKDYDCNTKVTDIKLNEETLKDNILNKINKELDLIGIGTKKIFM